MLLVVIVVVAAPDAGGVVAALDPQSVRATMGSYSFISGWNSDKLHASLGCAQNKREFKEETSKQHIGV